MAYVYATGLLLSGVFLLLVGTFMMIGWFRVISWVTNKLSLPDWVGASFAALPVFVMGVVIVAQFGFTGV